MITIKEGTLDLIEQANRLKRQAMIPLKIRIYNENTIDYYINYINNEFNEIYPNLNEHTDDTHDDMQVTIYEHTQNTHKTHT